MRTTFLAAATFSALSVAALAQDTPPPYDNGPVWVFTGIKTHDGHFDDYMQFLATKLKPENEALKKEGVLLDYKIFVQDAPRQGEPDVWIARLYPNMATFDRTPADKYALAQKIEGSITKANQEQAARGAIRDIVEVETLREITLK